MAAKTKPTIAVAMSGGVDSSVAAALLVERGFDVIGITMQIWQESQTDSRHAGCCSLGAVEDARRVARKLGIPHYVLNMKEEFNKSVIENFVSEYAAGRTPNPCVQCNRHVKFEYLLDKANEVGCEHLATGHYARIRRNAAGHYRLLQARGTAKDQSYVLYMLGQNQLSRLRFPLGELRDKSVTRKMAADYGLHLADKPDSQEICFVSEAGGYAEFLRKRRPEMFSAGQIVDQEGKVLGDHTGTAQFTVGQRRGIGVSGGNPLYVLKVSPASSTIVVGDAQDLLKREVLLEDVHWGVEKADRLRVMAKIRYNMEARPATFLAGPVPKLVFDEPVRAVAPGQIAVGYRGKTLVAGGKIVS
jgi:tRNA-specific 2-thiouridylase